ncbi:MAG TPA: hypothetical protein DCS13_13915 [Candidatus Margulisbacteria bacterium]|nr:MAG: hypothetical protein A2X43_03975 [Candidatus Margulisbacteria bacterium GWD2_39_127]HAR64555.1 hypothetical protein [Candidatus Margulisiibacteriota bacterium]
MSKWLSYSSILVFLCFVCTGAWTEERDIVKFGKDVVVKEGTTLNNVVVIGGHITLNGSVKESAVAVGGSIALGPKAVIGKDIVSVGGIIERASGSKIVGKIVEVDVPGMASNHKNWYGWLWGLGIFSLVTFIGFIALALMIIALFSRQISEISLLVESSPRESFLYGVLGIILIMPLTLMLIISIIGIFLVPLELLLIVAVFVTGYIAVAALIGKKVLVTFNMKSRAIIWEALLGLIILWLVGLVPVFGWFVKALAWIFGFGGIIELFLRRRKRNPA